MMRGQIDPDMPDELPWAYHEALGYGGRDVVLEEAHRNGNANWCEIHEEQRAFLERHLCSADCLSQQQRQDARSAVRRLAHHEAPYLQDDLFDFLKECVVTYCRAHPELIPRDESAP